MTIYIAVMTCPSLLLHPHSRVNDTSTDFGTVVQVLCETGYWFVDSATHIMGRCMSRELHLVSYDISLLWYISCYESITRNN